MSYSSKGEKPCGLVESRKASSAYIKESDTSDHIISSLQATAQFTDEAFSSLTEPYKILGWISETFKQEVLQFIGQVQLLSTPFGESLKDLGHLQDFISDFLECIQIINYLPKSSDMHEAFQERKMDSCIHYRKPIPLCGKAEFERLTSRKELISVLRDQITQDLYKPSVIPRDISVRDFSDENIKLIRKGNILDLDYANLRSRDAYSKATRIGTRPFLAIDMLMGGSKPHAFYHDIESIFYVLIWICQTQEGPNNPPRLEKAKDLHIRCWYDSIGGDVEMANMLKEVMMEVPSSFRRKILDYLPDYFKPLAPLFRKLRRIIFPIPDPNEDDEPLDYTEEELEKFAPERLKKEVDQKLKDMNEIIEVLGTWVDKLQQDTLISNVIPREAMVDDRSHVKNVKGGIPDKLQLCERTGIDEITTSNPKDEAPDLCKIPAMITNSKSALSGSPETLDTRATMTLTGEQALLNEVGVGAMSHDE